MHNVVGEPVQLSAPLQLEAFLDLCLEVVLGLTVSTSQE